MLRVLPYNLNLSPTIRVAFPPLKFELKNQTHLISKKIPNGFYKFPQKRREEIESMFELADLKKTKVYQEALGEGEQKEAFKLVLMLLSTRFQDLSPAYQEQIQALSTQQLEKLAKALLNFETEDDLKQWLSQNT